MYTVSGQTKCSHAAIKQPVLWLEAEKHTLALHMPACSCVANMLQLHCSCWPTNNNSVLVTTPKQPGALTASYLIGLLLHCRC